jgi:hypothetical protein
MRQTRIERVTFRLPRVLDRTESLQSDALPTELLALSITHQEACYLMTNSGPGDCHLDASGRGSFRRSPPRLRAGGSEDHIRTPRTF